MYVHCVSFRNELTNLSYMLSFGVNFGIHRRNLLITKRPLSAPWALCINSSSLFSSMLNWSCMGTSPFFCKLFKNEYLFSGIITLTSFAPPPPLLLFAWVNNRRASNLVFVFAVVLYCQYLTIIDCFFATDHQNTPIDSL